MSAWLLAGAFALDLALGDPRGWPHPVVWIGVLIEWLEAFWTTLCGRSRLAGALLAASTLLVVGVLTWGLLALARALHPFLAAAVSLWLGYSCLALRSLYVESRKVIDRLEAGDLSGARAELSMLVSRDTAGLDAEGVLRATIETVSENASDGVVAPLCYLALGGPVAALLYKAASTLDSMVGYRNDRYLLVGWASARLDDVLNWIPARLTALCMVAAAGPLGLDPRGAWTMMRRDAGKHASPNAGFPEAATAGALGIRLGGPAVYFGRAVEKPTLGDPLRPLTVESYRQAVRLMAAAGVMALGMGLLWRLFMV